MSPGGAGSRLALLKIGSKAVSFYEHFLTCRELRGGHCRARSSLRWPVRRGFIVDAGLRRERNARHYGSFTHRPRRSSPRVRIRPYTVLWAFFLESARSCPRSI